MLLLLTSLISVLLFFFKFHVPHLIFSYLGRFSRHFHRNIISFSFSFYVTLWQFVWTGRSALSLRYKLNIWKLIKKSMWICVFVHDDDVSRFSARNFFFSLLFFWKTLMMETTDIKMCVCVCVRVKEIKMKRQWII